jgi:hypothetical protein
LSTPGASEDINGIQNNNMLGAFKGYDRCILRETIKLDWKREGHV